VLLCLGSFMVHDGKLTVFFPVACHTDHVGPGSTFVAIAGTSCDGMQFIPAALSRGAARIIIQQDAKLPAEIEDAIVCAGAILERVADCRKALARLSAQAAGYPADKLSIIGITGTKGKTTTAYLLEQILRGCGYCTALLSTAGVSIRGKQLPDTSLTTPHADYLHQFFADCVREGVTHIVMEVAAQAVTMHRVDGILFDGLIFTNLALEHLEFYPSMDKYFAAKAALFEQLKVGAPLLIGIGDEWCDRLAAYYLRALRFGCDTDVDYVARIDGASSEQVVLELRRDATMCRLTCPALCGAFNGVNLAGAAAMALELGCDSSALAVSLKSFAGIPGRLQRHQLPNGAIGIIDYAHNPLSYEALLSTLCSMTDNLIVLFGAGGDRDASRRPQMGQIAAHYADHVVLTSDNPRTEDPFVIIDEIRAGIVASDQHKVKVVLDRQEAIGFAYGLSGPGAIVALLGKGPDEYQIVGNEKIPFSERRILESL